MNLHRNRAWSLVGIWGFVFMALLTLLSIRSSHANASVTLYYTIDRSAVPELTYNDLTLKVEAGDITDAEVSTLNGTPITHTYDSATGYVMFTTDTEQVKVVLNGVADPNSVGNISKATLKDDKKWAWSIGFDDNVFLQPAIDLLNAKGWAGTLFMISEKIDDTREEDWIIDTPDLHNLLDQGWSVGNHTWAHECFGQFDYQQTILDGYNRLQGIVDNSSKPDYKLISFAAPCFNGDYHQYILDMRDNGQTAVQFNESGNDYMLRVDEGQTSDFYANGITATAFDFDLAVGRDFRIEYDLPYVLTQIDWMASHASSNHHFWYNNLSHGNREEEIGQVVNYIYTTYGPDGTDEAWVAPSDVIYSYLLVRDNTVVTLSNGSPPPSNTPPSVSNPGEQNNTEGDTISLPITASDADGDTLTFSATGLPTGLSIDANSGTISGTLAAGSANTYNVTVTVNDGTDHESTSFTWNVNAPANQAPAITNPGDQSNQEGETLSLTFSAIEPEGDSLTLSARKAEGDRLHLTFSARDPEGDNLSFSATGLPDGLLIYSDTGTISGTIAIGAAANSPYTVTLSANDGNGGTDSENFTWTVNPLPAGEGSGQILREQWNGVVSDTIEMLTTYPAYPDNPDVQDHLTLFEIPNDTSDTYGTRMRGYLHPPVTGQYRFWIAADDSGELWLSTDDSPNNSTLIASVPELTLSQEWDKSPLQESTLITLQAGTRYYIEALHKEDSDHDHLAVAWQMPGGTREVIAGEYLSPYDPNTTPPSNREPSITNPGEQSNFAGDNVFLEISASDPDGDALTYSTTGLPDGFLIDSSAGTISGTIAPTATVSSPYSVTVSIDDGNGGSDSKSFAWTVNDPPTGGNTGQILRERWDDIFGKHVSDLTSDPNYPDNPNVQDYLTTFEIPSDVADIYGTRIRGYVHAPVTGEYRFWLASDNDGELWLSVDDDPNNATLIASVSEWSMPHGWDDNPSQESPAVTLQAGERYYIEALHKAEWGGDHLAVAWQIPGGSREVIEGQYLSPYDPSGAPASNRQPSLTNPGNQNNLTGDDISLSLSASDPDGDTLTYSATGLPDGLSIDSNTGHISGTLSSNSDGNHNVTVSVDDGNGGSDSESLTWSVTVLSSGNGVGKILHERWDDIFGKHIAHLTNDPAYPDNPDVQDYLTSFEIAANTGYSYGTRIRGYVHPPVTGEYRFWLASDNAGQLWLSTDDEPNNINLIASVSGWTNPREWDKFPSQKSNLITLQEGERYYIEALHKEEWGGDHLAVAWEIPGNTRDVIGGQYLSPYDINTTSADENQSMLNRVLSKPGRSSSTVQSPFSSPKKGSSR